MNERPTPETLERERDEAITKFAEIGSKLVVAERERDEAREAIIGWENKWKCAVEMAEIDRDIAKLAALESDRAHDRMVGELEGVYKERDEAQQRAKELAELVDGAYVLVELHKPEGAYNKKWRAEWMEKAARLVPGCDSLWY